MAKKSMKVKQQREPKYSTRAYTRCKICGRPHSYLPKSKFPATSTRIRTVSMRVYIVPLLFIPLIY